MINSKLTPGVSTPGLLYGAARPRNLVGNDLSEFGSGDEIGEREREKKKKKKKKIDRE